MKIFIIDDDHLSMFLSKNVLIIEDATLDIRTFLSGTEALAALHAGSEKSMPDVILLDLNMPIMNGWDFLDTLAPLKSRLCKDASIYVLTSSLDMADTARLKDYPFVSGLIHKPIKSEDMEVLFSFQKAQDENTVLLNSLLEDKLI